MSARRPVVQITEARCCLCGSRIVIGEVRGGLSLRLTNSCKATHGRFWIPVSSPERRRWVRKYWRLRAQIERDRRTASRDG